MGICTDKEKKEGKQEEMPIYSKLLNAKDDPQNEKIISSMTFSQAGNSGDRGQGPKPLWLDVPFTCP